MSHFCSSEARQPWLRMSAGFSVVGHQRHSRKTSLLFLIFFTLKLQKLRNFLSKSPIQLRQVLESVKKNVRSYSLMASQSINVLSSTASLHAFNSNCGTLSSCGTWFFTFTFDIAKGTTRLLALMIRTKAVSPSGCHLRTYALTP